ncbi:hypothetical protein KKC08_02445 [Patescibacteria group bacterium]|nr:hypothetical protein [Patescibacteria group bacterium]MCG2702649.1 hypothetical protein [Candidatus Parcubacteria bacterium]MBU4209941.1 hypothetical protein [Patescibacteria group bacterium]MBU4265457.1 hypothetical protein [Patescibacteria group bacterium]MBU4390507.1 hypothetical protein [Patescibacteria group bacterium]
MLLTKEKINQKKGIKAEQTDLVETISKVDKTSKNRRFVIIALLVTIGLSAIFAIYDLVKKTTQNGKYTDFLSKISLSKPQTDIPTKDISTPNIDISSLIEEKIINHQGVWSFYIKYYSFASPQPSASAGSDSEKIIYTRNESVFFSKNNPSEILKSLKDPDDKQAKIFTKNLPDGLEIYEKNQSTENSIESHLLIILPNNKQIFILIKTTEVKDNSQLPSLISQLVSDIYWSLLQSD